MSGPASGPGAGYAERLAVPLRWWALATMFLASVLLAFLVALPAWVAGLGAAALAGAAVALLVGYGSACVVVHDGHLSAGHARIPVSALARPEALGAEATRRALGREADARAYLLVRPYLRESVRVTVADPADPTPYWLVSTRHPRRLVAAIEEATATPGLVDG